MTVIMKLLIIFLAIKVSLTLDNGLAIQPPMGWMWSSFFCKKQCSSTEINDCISDKLVRRNAEIMKREGYVEAGYNYILIASCWMAEKRDYRGKLQPDPSRFPHGIKPLADYLHSLGMKLGLTASLGKSTCSGRFSGSKGQFEKDVKTFVDWGIDMLRADACFVPFEEYDESFIMMGFSLNSTGRHINYQCAWPATLMRNAKTPAWNLIRSSCNMYDVYDGGHDSWQELLKVFHHFYVHNKTLVSAGKGAWNFAGPMKIDSRYLDANQSLAHMAIYAALGLPLFIKGAFKLIPEEKANILKNPILLSIHRDPLAQVGFRLNGHYYNGIQIWVRRLVNRRLAVIFLNIEYVNAIYSSFSLLTFLPFFPGAEDNTLVNIDSVFEGTSKNSSFKDDFEVKTFTPTSCLLVILKALGS